MRRRRLLTMLAGAALKPALALGASDTLELDLDARPALRLVYGDPTFQLQWLCSVYRRGDRGWILDATYYHGYRPRSWFAAASFVKLPLAALLLELLEREGLAERVDDLRLRIPLPPNRGALPEGIERGIAMATLLRAMLSISDNASYNALYELLGSDRIHERLAAIGYPTLRMAVRMGGASGRKLRAELLDAKGKRVYASPAQAREAPQRFAYGQAIMGRAWMENGRVIPGPHDFSASNFIGLADLQRLISELGSGAQTGAPRFALGSNSRHWLRAVLSSPPRLQNGMHYPEARYPDSYARHFHAGPGPTRQPSELLVASKNARSYGWIGDSAWIEDQRSGCAYALSAVLYVDRDGVLNDGVYAYDEIGIPALRELAAAVLERVRQLAG